MSKPSTVAVYARISSDQDGTALGVQRQVADCRDLAERLGWTVAEEYVDNDLSAYSGKRRPAYERMLDDLRDGLRDGVLVYHADRLTRRPIELEQFLEVLTAAKVHQVRFVSGADVDIGNGDGLLVLRMMSAVAANESANKSRRVRRKMIEVAQEGRPHGGAHRPFGFEDDKITVRADEAEIIRALAARFLAGESLRSLCSWLDAEEIRTSAGKVWRTSTLRQMLRSGRIAGLRENRGEVIGPAVWDAIITDDEHRRIRALMDRRASTGERSVRSYLLSGVMVCGKCDGRLFASRRVDRRRYVCQSGPDHQGCGGVTVTAERVEELVTNAVLYRLDSTDLAASLAGKQAADSHAAAVSDAIADDAGQLEELAQLYAAKQISAKEWMSARNPIEARRADNERQLARLTRTDALAGLIGNAEQLSAQWSSLNLTRQAAIVRALIDRIVIAPVGSSGPRRFSPDRVDIVWRV